MQSASPHVNFKSSQIFRAGAGAGKTTQLVQEVYDFYNSYKKQNNKNPKIVLTTFTRKATQELKERLMLKAQQNQDYEFLDFVLSKGNLLISTIHGVLQVFLKQYAQTIGLDPGFQIVDRKTIFQEAKFILQSILKEHPQSMALLDEFSFKQLVGLLINHSDNIMKNNNVSPLSLEDFERDQKLQKDEFIVEIQSLVRRIEEQDSQKKWADFCDKLRVLANLITHNKFEDLEDHFSSIKKPPKNSKNPVIDLVLDEEVQAFLKKIKGFDFELLDPSHNQLFIEAYGMFDEISGIFHKSFIQLKKEKGLLSLSDLESFTLEILRQDANRYSSFSKNYDYWLIDEFQDTAPVQVKILMSIIGTQKFFVVGDPQQSIYFFRGARVRVFDEMQEAITTSGGQLKYLKTNYRSSPHVMSFINYFFQNYDEKFSEMEIGGKQISDTSIQIGLFESDLDQAQKVAQHILNLSQNSKLGDICVIARKNDQLKDIAAALKKRHIPYYLHSAQGYSQRREIQDLKSFLKFLVNPHDNLNFLVLLRSPWFAMKDSDIIKLTRKTKASSYWSLFLKEYAEHDSIQKLQSYIQRSLSEGISLTFQNFILESRILETSLVLDPTGRREANIWKFLTSLRSEDHSPDFNYLKFIDAGSTEVSSEEGGDNADAVSSLEPNQVQLMTVHMSKGLEFDHVIIPYLEKEPNRKYYVDYMCDEESAKWAMALRFDKQTAVTPLPLKKMLKSKIEEELKESHRLLYVAMTRAKKSLLLSTAGKAESDSWLKSMRIPLEFGSYSYGDYSYSVIQDVPVQVSSFKKRDKVVSELKPLSSQAADVTEETSVTQKLKWLNQGVDHVVPLMKSALEGVRLHKIFETLKYKSVQDVLLQLNAKDKEAVTWLLETQDIPFQQILNKGFAEWGFVVKTETGTLSGQIDLWGQIQDSIWVIDYKTGSSRYSEKALSQLKIYADVLRRKFKPANIHIAAVYPFEKKIIKSDF